MRTIIGMVLLAVVVTACGICQATRGLERVEVPAEFGLQCAPIGNYGAFCCCEPASDDNTIGGFKVGGWSSGKNVMVCDCDAESLTEEWNYYNCYEHPMRFSELAAGKQYYTCYEGN